MAYLHKLDARNATKPRRSLRLLIQREVAPYQVILFGEEGFWLDDQDDTGLPPPDGYRIVCDDSIHSKGSANANKDEEDTATVETASDITTASNNTQASDDTFYFIIEYSPTALDQDSEASS